MLRLSNSINIGPIPLPSGLHFSEPFGVQSAEQFLASFLSSISGRSSSDHSMRISTSKEDFSSIVAVRGEQQTVTLAENAKESERVNEASGLDVMYLERCQCDKLVILGKIR